MDSLLEGGRYRAPGLFHRLDGRGGGAGHFEVHLCLEPALAEQPDAIARVLDKTGLEQACAGNGSLGLQLALVDRPLNPAEVDLGEVVGEEIVEAALRNTHVERHLTAFETMDRDARAGLGTLHAAPTGLADAGA